MTIAQVSAECFLATADKAFQQNPCEFTAETLLSMLEEQPVLTEGLIGLTTDLSGIVAEPVDEEIQARAFTMAASVICLMWKAIKAQDEANELEEMMG
tara:strand:+ start:580 stop:873 length:294 start_codon:yes stop_codon:yes gene_type:complete